MANIEQKFVLFLADPQFSKDELNKFKKTLSGKKISNLFQKANKIKKILAEDPEYYQEPLQIDKLSAFEKKIFMEVDSILRKELHLNVKNIINLLSLELNINIPASKRSFKDAILFLIEHKDGSQIINAVHKIRKSMINNDMNNDWPLLDSKS